MTTLERTAVSGSTDTTVTMPDEDRLDVVVIEFPDVLRAQEGMLALPGCNATIR